MERRTTTADRYRYLHVANGHCTTRTIEAAGIPGMTSIWADPLHDGPVPAGLDDAALMAVRSEYHAPSAHAAPDPANDLRLWRQVIARHEAWDELILWYEHDLFDQVNLLQLLPWIRRHVPQSKPVSLICIGSFPGHPDFHGLGELQPDELASLFETRQPMEPAHYDLAERAWSAFRHPTPEALDAFVNESERESESGPAGPRRPVDASPLPFLRRALRRFLEEYPWVGDGLSRSERTLMALAAEGRADGPAVLSRMHAGEDAFYVTDTALSERTAALTAASPPLLVEANGSLSLTADGRGVLEGRADRVTLCGIDRWFGGVRLQGRSVAWRWHARSERIVPA